MSWVELQPAGDRDRFLGALPQWLRSAGFEIGWLRNPVAWLHSVEAIARSVHQNSRSEPAAVVGRFFGIRALLASYGHLLMLPFALKHRLQLGGIDLKRIVRLALRREMRSARLVASALYAGLASSLKRAGLVPRTLFYTYENQPWEKAMLSSFRRAQPGTQLIGVQHAQFSDRYFSGQPSSRQWNDGTAPDRLMTIGSEFRDRLIGLGAPADRLQVGGALRYADLLGPRAGAAPKAMSERRLVLATCSMEARDSFELAHKAAAATSALSDVRLAINFHPLVDAKFRQTIREQMDRFVDCSHVEFVEGGAVQWLEQADVLLYNSSNTVLEAAAMRVPAIFVESDVGLDVDVFSGAGSFKCRDVADLRRHIEILLADAGRRLSAVETASNYMSRCFAPPRAKDWTALATNAMAS
jgi:surface carbohydrate biosynthesis protein (TIGR04326 family)